MEQSLLPGDAVLVSKLHYGPRTPSTISIPFTGRYLPELELRSFRLPGLSSVQRNDIVVFNFPREDGPIERRTHYVKRAVGLPGDEVNIRDKALYVNGQELPMGDYVQQQWVARVREGARQIADSLRALGATPAPEDLLSQAGRVTFEATRSIASKVEAWQDVDDVTALVHAGRREREVVVFPRGRGFSRDNYGPVYVPARGDTVDLTPSNWPLYRTIITEHEGHDAKYIGEGHFLIDGQMTDQYVFVQDYYFVLGDNRDNSSDSRMWGFVPESHLVGKVIMIYFSWNKEREEPRYGRLLLAVE